MDLKKCLITCIHHCGITKSIFTNYPEKSSVLHLVISSSPWTPDNHWYFHCLHSCIFSRMLYSWNHIALSDWLLLFSNIHVRFLNVFSWLDSSSLFITGYSIICMYHSLSIHLLKDILVASKFWKMWIKLLYTLCAGFCVDISFQFLSVKCQGTRLLNHMVRKS